MKNIIIISDHTVWKKFAYIFKQYHHIILPPGETIKCLTVVEQVCEQLVKLGCNRQTTLIALGGGVIGDVTGFVASIYMRGIKYIQCPTTLLAMVDSSIGSKTGVDLASGKNLIGTFYAPEQIVIDPTILADLPETQLRQGMGEVIKYGLLDKQLFLWLEQHRVAIKKRQPKILQQLVKQCVQIKQVIITADQQEQNIRMLLNLGHTFGHAFEQLSHYKLPHGAAVAIGLVYAAKFAYMPELERLIHLLMFFNLPIKLPKAYPVNQVIKVMQHDKKRRGQNLTLVLPEAIGKVTIHNHITKQQIYKFLENLFPFPSIGERG